MLKCWPWVVNCETGNFEEEDGNVPFGELPLNLACAEVMAAAPELLYGLRAAAPVYCKHTCQEGGPHTEICQDIQVALKKTTAGHIWGCGIESDGSIKPENRRDEDDKED